MGTGRFNTADPSTGGQLGKPATWNKYAYVVGDPVNFKDRRGLFYSNSDPNRPCIECEEPEDDPEEDPAPLIGPPLPTPEPDPTPEPPGGGTPQYPGQTKARAALADPKCAAALGTGKTSSADAQAVLDKTVFSYGYTGNFNGMGDLANLGRLVVNEGADGKSIAAGSGIPSISYTTNGVNYIALNGNVNWFAPDSTVAVDAKSGSWTQFQLATAVGGDMGMGTLSADQFDTLVVLHELSHLLGAPQEKASGAFNLAIFRDCIH